MTTRNIARMAVAILLAVSTAQAATIFVDIANCPDPGDGSATDPYCSIQTAIDNAVDTDEIVVAPGTYFETINFLGKAVTLRSSDGADVTIIDGTGFFHVVQCVNGEGPDTILDGFTITGGNANGPFPDNLGGGMYNELSSPTVSNCTFTGNSAAGPGGGGMTNNNSNPTVSDCTFSANSADGNGGGMSNFISSPTVTNCTFDANSVGGDGGGMHNLTSSPAVTNCTFSGNEADNGGGMFSHDSSPTVTDCTFTGNSAKSGGGMLSGDGSPTVTNCTFTDNVATNSGGGIVVGGGSPTITGCTFTGNQVPQGFGGGLASNTFFAVTVTDCTFSGNDVDPVSGVGGGAYNGGRANFIRCTFSGNSGTRGGGVMMEGIGSLLRDCVFTGNTALQGGGLRAEGAVGLDVINCLFSGNAASVRGGGISISFTDFGPTVINCTISQNSAGGDGGGIHVDSHVFATIQNSVIWGNDLVVDPDSFLSVEFSDVEGGFAGSGNIDQDPLFSDSAGGDFTLSSGSPCIDAGDNTAVPKDVTTDLDGNPRFVDDPDTPDSGNGTPPIVDMGAYEAQGALLCPWDCGGDDDGNTGITDFLALLAQWGGPGACDFDGGGVGITDFLLLLANWGACP